MDIKRYNVGYLGLEESKRGRFVQHGDYVQEVKKLQSEIEELKERLDDSSIFSIDLGDEDRSPYSAEDD
jgi:hypothetical protein